MPNGLDSAKRFNSARLARQNSTQKVLPIEYSESIRFMIPAQPSFTVGSSMLSVMSLVVMSLLSTIMFLQLLNPQNNLIAPIQNAIPFLSTLLNYLRPPAGSAELSAWTWVPFLFTIFGAALGWVFELGLILSGTPFQQQKNVCTRTIQQVRFLNIAPVTMSIFFFVSSMAVSDPSLRLAMLYIASAGTFALGFGLFFGGATVLPFILLGTQVLQLVMVLLVGIPVGGHFLIAQAILQFTALVVGTATPLRSTGFHLLSTLSGIVLYNAILSATAINPNYSMDVAVSIPSGSLVEWGAIAACAFGLFAAVKAFPVSYGNFQVIFSNLIWSPLYFKLVSAERFPDPFSLKKVYEDKRAPARASLKPYYIAHPLHLINKLSIPALDDSELERNVTVFSKLLKEAKSAFALISFLDHHLPQAKVSTPIAYKQRMTIWSDGQQYWPCLFSKKIFGATLPNNGQLDSTPKVAITAFQEGQLLAYLAEAGVANTFLMPAPDREVGTLVADFRFLEKYETKPDYESYGGAAYFIINAVEKKLELVSLVAPHSTEELIADPHDPSFRHAERLVLASMYYQVISGKHLAEIHMTYNLVEVCMHNAFDAQGQWLHPFRTFMYLHFFSHELAEEVTTEHLIQDGAVFSQIFATTHDALINHLNDCYSNFEYGVDEDFEARQRIMTIPSTSGTAQILPNACINWELEYFAIWHTYTTQLIDIIYIDDDAVRSDRYLQDFHTGLLQVLLKGLPVRYQNFQTKAGVARFAADTIHHMVVRHQVYGTTGIRAALDPRISQVQVPKDGDTYPVDEWRSLAFVALATGQARFTLLTDKDGKDFTYLLEGIDERLRNPMAKVFDRLQESLVALDKKWTKDQMEKDFNYDFFRALPSDLHTGPGY